MFEFIVIHQPVFDIVNREEVPGCEEKNDDALVHWLLVGMVAAK
jgi:hypothetical protein